MFKQWKENRENKRDILMYQAFLLRTLSEIVLEFKKSQDTAKKSGISEKDAMEILNNLKGVNQNDIVAKIVESIKTKEKAE
jgi:hypothetical protein